MSGLAEAEFEALYDRLARPLLLTLVRRAMEVDVALDLWAETWAAAFAARRRFRGHTREEAEGWVRGIAARQYAMYMRRGRAERRALERLGLERPAPARDEIEELERLAGIDRLRALVAEGLAQLNADQRDALRLRIVDELPYPDVARLLSVSEPTARARVSRGLRALREVLDPAVQLDSGAV
jgi:RNA polymerase sigma-70 factor (ECF subfamily)